MKRIQELEDINQQLLWPYVISEENPSAKGYLEWAQYETDPTLKLNKSFFIYKRLLTFALEFV